MADPRKQPFLGEEEKKLDRPLQEALYGALKFYHLIHKNVGENAPFLVGGAMAFSSIFATKYEVSLMQSI